MALTKVTKHVVYGSMLIQNISRDISDMSTSSSSYTNWGETLTITPQYSDSHLEITFTGATNVPDQFTQNTDNHFYARFIVNGSQVYEVTGINGQRNTGGGHRVQYNSRFGQSHHQDFDSHSVRSGVGMFKIIAPGTTNAQVVQVQVRSTASRNINCLNGFLAVSEISGPGHNQS